MRLRCVSPNLPICRASFAYRATSPSQSFRSLSTYASSFVRHVSHPSSLHQLYISHANDPFLNLSIEHFLLTHTPPTSTTLFLYANRPSVIIGRNQNPWLESNLRALRSPSASLSGPANPPIDLVRRRSGGGAVFHDGGNINYSVLCPPAAFARDLHAAMLARALRRSNPRARVNERHDVVLDQGGLLPEPRRPPADDARTSAYEPGVPLKVSGSAYKITRTRALHHGTCLVASPNVGRISGLLRSPARPYVKARGVDSVRSPVGNAYTEAQSDAVAKFTKDVLDEFCTMHGLDMSLPQKLVSQKQASSLETFDRSVYGWLGGELAEVPEVCAGMEELKVRLVYLKLLSFAANEYQSRHHGSTLRLHNSPSQLIPRTPILDLGRRCRTIYHLR